jgi:hypothetical protein
MDLKTPADKIPGEPIDESKRNFLSVYGKAALIAPPVITGLLATSMSSPAIARTTGGGGGGGKAGLGFLLGAAPAGVIAAAPREQAVPVRESRVLSAEAPPPEEIQVPPAPPPPPPGPERG